MPSVTRAQFVEAVEMSLRGTPTTMTDHEKSLLRHVAQTEPRFRVGSFGFHSECGCPLTLAGLYTPGCDLIWFGGRFDRYIQEVGGVLFDFDSHAGVIVDVVG